MGRFIRIRGFRVPLGLGLAMVLPILVVLRYSVGDAVVHFRTANGMTELHNLVKTRTKVTDLIHELQIERGSSATFIHSSGESFAELMRGQRAKSLAALSELEAAATLQETMSSGDLSTLWTGCKRRMQDLEQLRLRVDSRSVEYDDALEFYTKTITQLTRLVAKMGSTSVDVNVSRAVTTYVDLLESIELAGLERVHGSVGFLSGSFAPATHGEIESLITAQGVRLESFRRSAQPNAIALLDQALSNDVFFEVEQLRKVVASSIETGSTGDVTAEQWFAALTGKIEILKTVGAQLDADLGEMTTALAQEAQKQSLGRLMSLLFAVVATGLVGWVLVSEVTARRKEHAEVKKSEARLAEIMSAALDGFVTIDEDGAIVDFNSAAESIFGYPKEHAVGRNFAELAVPAEQREDFVRAISHRGIAAPGQWTGKRLETTALRADGAQLAVEVAVSAIEVSGKRYFTAHIRDLSERRRLETRLRQSEKLQALGQLAGGVAHDFNNQLQVMSGFSEILLGRLEDPDLRGYVTRIMRSADHAAKLTGQLLAFARKGRRRSEAVDMHSIIEETVSVLGRSLDKRIEIEQHLEADPCVVIGDASQLQNTFLNLAINAKNAMEEGGKISFSTDKLTLPADVDGQHSHGLGGGTFIRIIVSDDGVGMTTETKTRLFEPFFTTRQEGVGLGLASVYGAIMSHQGSIDVESTPGDGSAFTILLPLADGVSSVVVKNPRPVKPVASALILVVDDEELVREVTCAMIQSFGHRVLSCGSGAEALEAYRKAKGAVDLVVLDLIMPSAGGREVFRDLRMFDSDAEILICSGHSVEGEAQQILDQGAVGFLSKPFEREALSEELAKVLGKG